MAKAKRKREFPVSNSPYCNVLFLFSMCAFYCALQQGMACVHQTKGLKKVFNTQAFILFLCDHQLSNERSVYFLKSRDLMVLLEKIMHVRG